MSHFGCRLLQSGDGPFHPRGLLPGFSWVPMTLSSPAQQDTLSHHNQDCKTSKGPFQKTEAR